MGKIKSFFNRIFGKNQKKLPEAQVTAQSVSNQETSSIVAPKNEPATLKDDLKSLLVAEKTLYEKELQGVKFQELTNDEKEQLLSKVPWNVKDNYSEIKEATGHIGGQAFITFGKTYEDKRLGRKDISKNIIKEDGSQIQIYKATQNGEQVGRSYKEKSTLEDGTENTFSVDNTNNVYNWKEKGDIRVKEYGENCTMAGTLDDIEKYAQPSDKLAQEYEKATGLPLIGTSYSNSITAVFREDNENNHYPYCVGIESIDRANKEQKKLQYVYRNAEEYANGAKPYMVYMSGIDGREGPSGIFRLREDGTYVDNSTFRKEGESYTFDTVSLEDIKGMTKEFPSEVSDRVADVIKNGFKIPDELEEIYAKDSKLQKAGQENPTI